MSVLKAIVFSLLAGVSLCAQSFQTVRGEVVASRPLSVSGYIAELYDASNHQVVERTILGPDGAFEFNASHSGRYSVQISTTSGYLVATADVDPAMNHAPLSIRLPEAREPKPVSGVVSVTSLMHPPARKAFSECEKAEKFARMNDTPHSIEHLRKAIEISPDYADAHSQLGVQYMRSGRYEDALTEYQTVVRIGPAGPGELCNLAVALFALRRTAEAADAATRALAINASYLVAHYILGRALSGNPATREESRRHLELASAAIPQAKAYLAAMK